MGKGLKRKAKSALEKHKWMILFIGILVIGYSSLVLLTGTLLPIKVVESDSMLPTLARGDLIFVKTTSVNNLDAGSIIVYEPPKPYPSSTIHRVIDKWFEEDTIYFKTKGDNNNSPDSYRITASNIIAEYTGIRIPLIGHIILFIQTPIVTVSLFGVFVLWVVYVYVFKNGSNIEKM